MGHVEPIRSVLVALDFIGRADLGLPRVLAGLPQGPALPQQVPALVQRHLQRLQSPMLFVLVDLPTLQFGAKLLLFCDESVNFGEDVLIFSHTASLPDYGWSGEYKT
ncbi:hypothetical protein AFM11_07895 [Mycolicibacterium wolinskyi]|uniref:Uncharacterized protein n=1 Tax=Mycolicibacterium wolinskyi TaxID=59750 RepID=A0A132PQP3_9MYCO|nr:hypothetical protein AFM11_07895 [Mycolicibacterium wolinskyi]